MKSITIVSFCCLLLFTSCNKFLDVTPADRVFEDELFENKDGFENALADVYNQMTQSSQYGFELKMGMFDVMVGYYTISAQQHSYSPIMPLNFTVPQYQSRLATTWSGLYSDINRVNHIVKNIDKIKGDAYHNLILGEALGLRAFLHFELLRMFGPPIKEVGVNTKAIPYYKEIKNQPQPFLTSAEVLNLIESDLVAAETLLVDDPIKTLGRTGDGNGYGTLKYNSLIDRRGTRMNYFAVLALKARKSLWEGKLEAAYTRAAKLMTGLPSDLRLVNASDIASSYVRNKRFTSENIFSLFVSDHRNLLLERLPPLNATTTTSSLILLPQYTNLSNTLYNAKYGSINDYRLLNWFAPTATGQYRLTKFEVNPDNPTYLEQFEVSLVSLAEMYLIMAEAKVVSDPAVAISILNSLRLSRNLSEPIVYDAAAMTSENILQFIIDEARKNFIGEGQMYFMYKRLFRTIVRPTGNVTPTIDNMRFPIPVEEESYNNSK